MMTPQEIFNRYVTPMLIIVLIMGAYTVFSTLHFKSRLNTLSFEGEVTVVGTIAEILPSRGEIVLRSLEGAEQRVYVQDETILYQPIKTIYRDGRIAYSRKEISTAELIVGDQIKVVFQKDSVDAFPVLTHIVVEENTVEVPPLTGGNSTVEIETVLQGQRVTNANPQ